MEGLLVILARFWPSKTISSRCFEKLEKDYDAITSDNKEVQIKATFKDHITYPAIILLKCFLLFKSTRTAPLKRYITVRANTLGELIKGRKAPYNRLHRLAVKKLREINKRVKGKERGGGRGDKSFRSTSLQREPTLTNARCGSGGSRMLMMTVDVILAIMKLNQ